MIDFDPSKWLDPIARFFDLSRAALVRMSAIAMAGVILLIIDVWFERIAFIDRWMLGAFYLFAIFCACFVIIALGLPYIEALKGRREDAARSAEEDTKALANLDAISNLHKACLIYLKQRNQKRWSDENWQTLRAMAGSNFLSSERASNNVFWWEVRDAVWDSPQLVEWAERAQRLPSTPWDVRFMMLYNDREL